MSQVAPDHILWASTPAAYAAQRYPSPRIDALELEALFDQWQAAVNQWDFMASLPLDQAAELCGFILARVPPGTPTRHAKELHEKRHAAAKKNKKKKAPSKGKRSAAPTTGAATRGAATSASDSLA